MLIKNIPLPSPQALRDEIPLSAKGATFLTYARLQSSLILERKLPLFAVVVGPCSIHDPTSAIEYALRLQKLSLELSGSLFLIMRFFLEKPRTKLGWKGMLYDPYLDGSYDMIEGIKRSRKLLVYMAELGVPCACELLDPLVFNYFEDLISWGFIGARTSASPIHRQLASGVSFPVGFKNSIHGDIDTAVAGAFSAKHPHCHIGIDAQGQISSVETCGNPWTHIVLRGSTKGSNFHPSSVAIAKEALQQHKLNPLILIDCGHGNSRKQPLRQKIAFTSAVLQAAAQNSPIVGTMLESHLFAGKQQITKNPENLRYGVSITDPCLGWEETEHWLRWAETVLSGCKSMSSTQK